MSKFPFLTGENEPKKINHTFSRELLDQNKGDTKSLPQLSPLRDEDQEPEKHINLKMFDKIDENKEPSQVSDLQMDVEKLNHRSTKRTHKRSMSEEAISRQYVENDLNLHCKIQNEIDNSQHHPEKMNEEKISSTMIKVNCPPSDLIETILESFVFPAAKPKTNSKSDNKKKSPNKSQITKTKSRPIVHKESDDLKNKVKEEAMNEEIPKQSQISSSQLPPRKKSQSVSSAKTKKQADPPAKTIQAKPTNQKQSKQTPNSSKAPAKNEKPVEPLNALDIITASKPNKQSSKPNKESKDSQTSKPAPSNLSKKSSLSRKNIKQENIAPAEPKDPKKDKEKELPTAPTKEIKTKGPNLDKKAITSKISEKPHKQVSPQAEQIKLVAAEVKLEATDGQAQDADLPPPSDKERSLL